MLFQNAPQSAMFFVTNGYIDAHLESIQQVNGFLEHVLNCEPEECGSVVCDKGLNTLLEKGRIYWEENGQMIDVCHKNVLLSSET